LFVKNIVRSIVLVLFVLTITNAAFAASEIVVQNNPPVNQQTEQSAFSPDVPINGLWWTEGSYNNTNGYWNSLGEFQTQLLTPINE